MTWEVRQGDCLDRLREMPDGSVHCAVTSPPYWGLRDYGVDGQIGLEPTPEAYVARMVEVFREVRRVLRDDGTLWLNMGDSYSRAPEKGGSGIPNGRNTDAMGYGAAQISKLGSSDGFVGRSDRPGSRASSPDLKPKDLVGVPWMLAFALRQPYEVVKIKSHTDRAWMAAMIDGEGCISTTVAKPTTGINESYAIIIQIRMSDRQCLDRVVEITGMSRVQDEVLPPSMTGTGQRPVYCWKIAGENAAAILAEVYPYLCIKRGQAVAAWNLQRLKDGVTTKRGVPVPEENMEKRRLLHRVIRSLNQREAADVPGWCAEPTFEVVPGWYLRSDVIWSKPNPMPESVTDRPTKAHEYVFLLSKNARYWYDSEAIKEPSLDPDDNRAARERLYNPDDKFVSRLNPATAKCYPTRNARSVWTIATQPYAEAHFATYPEALVTPCIKAGCPEGGTVLDPFSGSGTTGAVAVKLGRSYIGIELNPAYIAMSHKRIGLAENPLTWRSDEADTASLFHQDATP